MLDTPRTPVTIEVLHVDDCPNVALLIERLSASATAAGVGVEPMLVLVESHDLSNELRFGGSPTLRIDGVDPFPTDGTPSFGCRLYAHDGAFDGSPSISQLTTVLMQSTVS